MRKFVFLFPRMEIRSGGHLAQWRFHEVFKDISPTTAATYQSRVPGFPFLDDLLEKPRNPKEIFVIHWGPNVPTLIDRLDGRNVVYFSHSTGWGFKLPSHIPVVTVSKNSQAYWGRHAPNQFIMRLPNVIGDEYSVRNTERDIDVLIQKRKSSDYLINVLAPALAPHCKLKILDDWVVDLSDYFNRTKIYLYDSTDHWAGMNASEGFGLPPLEAMACGCTVFSSVNDSLSDYLDPGFNCHKLRCYSTAFDQARILDEISRYSVNSQEALIQPYREPAVRERAAIVIEELEYFFDQSDSSSPDLPCLPKATASSNSRFEQMRAVPSRLFRGVLRLMCTGKKAKT